MTKDNYNKEVLTIKVIAQNNGYDKAEINRLIKKEHRQTISKFIYAAALKTKQKSFDKIYIKDV